MSILSSFNKPAQNGWTPWQYAIFRVALGLYLLCHFVSIAPWASEMFSNQGCLPAGSLSPLLHVFPNILCLSDSPLAVCALITVAIAACGLLTAGVYDRVAAVVLWYICACLFGRNPLILNPALPYTGVLLLAHACIPKQSAAMPGPIYAAVWILLACGYSYSGYTKLVSPSWLDGTAAYQVLSSALSRPTLLRQILLWAPPAVLTAASYTTLLAELLFAPLALFPRSRLAIWALLALMHIAFLDLIDFADLSTAMLLAHAFTFDPSWISPVPTLGYDRIFYDGKCGLCHGAIRFILSENKGNQAFRFAPLAGDRARSVLLYADIPDSLIVVTDRGRVLHKSQAWVRILGRLGGIWRIVSVVLAMIPARIRDRIYDKIAESRHTFFDAPAQVCPTADSRLVGLFNDCAGSIATDGNVPKELSPALPLAHGQAVSRFDTGKRSG